jgi:hypothetical protein
MLGFLKNLFTAKPPARPAVAAPAVARPEPRPTAVAPKPAMASPAPKPKAVPAAGSKEEVITLTLQGLVSKLPDHLKDPLAAEIKKGATFAIPVSLVLDQLPKGSVKIPYAELVRSFKPGVFPPASAADPATVELPLSEVLGQLKPNAISRRAGQRIAEVPAEIVSPFGQNLRGKEPARSAGPIPITSAPPAKPNSAAEQGVSKGDEVPLASAPVTKVQPSTSPSGAPAKTKELDGFISLPLSALGSEFENVILNHFPALGSASIRMPRGLIESESKRGKLVFDLKQVARWLEPAPSVQGIGDDQKIELPLKFIAPILFSRSPPVKARQQVTIPDAIPDVFRGRVPEPVSGVSAEVPSPATAPNTAPSLGELKPAEDTKLPTVEITVAGLISEISLLPGVDGVVASTFDGFLVAGERLDGFSHQSFAAFGPQMFNRLAQYGRELQLGEAQVLTVYFNQKPIRLFQAGRLLVVVAGRELEPLPDAEIEKLAAKLAQAKS